MLLQVKAVNLQAMNTNPLHQAVEIAGGVQHLARVAGVRYQSVQGWLEKGRPPAKRVLAIEAATGISRHALLPDVYGPEPKNAE